MTVPNFLTISRVFVSPIYLVIYLMWEELGIASAIFPFILLTLLILSELSDAFDGFIARRYGLVSELGKVLDPMADSLHRVSIFLTFTLPPVSLPLLLIFIFIYRDSVISTLRTVCAIRGYTLSARISGKVKAIFQALATLSITALLIPYSRGVISQGTLSFAAFWITLAVAIFTLYSGFDYLVAMRNYLKTNKHNHPDANP